MSAKYRLLGAVDRGGDVLEVRYQLEGEDQPRTVRGWVSATTQHYEPDAYQDDGHRKAGAQPRAMSEAEIRAYVDGLIQAAHPQAPEPRTVLEADPA